jgi:hypothetical protein
MCSAMISKVTDGGDELGFKEFAVVMTDGQVIYPLKTPS